MSPCSARFLPTAVRRYKHIRQYATRNVFERKAGFLFPEKTVHGNSLSCAEVEVIIAQCNVCTAVLIERGSYFKQENNGDVKTIWGGRGGELDDLGRRGGEFCDRVPPDLNQVLWEF